jgi:hypothetical protein
MPADPQPSFDNMLAEAAEALADRWIGLEGKATPHTHVDGIYTYTHVIQSYVYRAFLYM